MSEPLDELYLTWLYKEVLSPRHRNPARTYWGLFGLLYSKEFVWIVPNDDNRVADGKELRREFSKDVEDYDPDWCDLGCSVLEMLIGLSRRLAFEGGGSAARWFWALIKNLDLDIPDTHFPQFDVNVVDNILEMLIWRQYRADGRGGLFPLVYPDRDQRDVEIWYQLNAYLLENS